MAWYSEYKGKYRLRCEVDQNTGEFPKRLIDGEPKGKFIDDDVYIETNCGRIYWYDRGILEAWVGNLNGVSKATTYNKILKDNKAIILEEGRFLNDGEGTFRFKKPNLEPIVTSMGGDYKTCTDRSPFSVKNLEKDDYEIPKSDLVAFDVKLKIHDYRKMYLDFAIDIGLKEETFKAELKNPTIKPKEYFHKIGKWNELIKFSRDWESM